LFFDNFFMDFLIRQKIEKSIQDMEQSARQLNPIVSFVAQSLDMRRNNVRMATQQYESIQGIHRKYRISILKALLEQRKAWRGRSGSAGPTSAARDVSPGPGMLPLPDFDSTRVPTSGDEFGQYPSASPGASRSASPSASPMLVPPGNPPAYDGGASPRLGSSSPAPPVPPPKYNPFRE
jgi:hypothetical protein